MPPPALWSILMVAAIDCKQLVAATIKSLVQNLPSRSQAPAKGPFDESNPVWAPIGVSLGLDESQDSVLNHSDGMLPMAASPKALASEQSESDHYFMQVLACTSLICNQQIAVLKKYHIGRHYDTNHVQIYKKYSGKAHEDKIKELELSVKKQQSLSKNFRQVSDACVKASYIISNEIAVSSRPFTEGDFVKKCMLLTADVIYPDKRQALANISLSRNTKAEGVNETAEDIDNNSTALWRRMRILVDCLMMLMCADQVEEMLKSFYKLRYEIIIFMKEKGKEVHELNDMFCLKDLAFMVDITDHLNNLNIQMQGKNKLVTEFYDLIRALEIKLKFFQGQIAAHNLAHFPSLKSMQNANTFDDGDPTEKY
ncbi:general transcription factor II-I repeat domain-containing protein 2-like [Palaemon carinicauda]|uniref:general transcription factor II-I repeat domain-containing protein 2-like n=1 Tax=Palaemon carinicauda TaxID=392227 RepID=UPI0035B6430B